MLMYLPGKSSKFFRFRHFWEIYPIAMYWIFNYYFWYSTKAYHKVVIKLTFFWFLQFFKVYFKQGSSWLQDSNYCQCLRHISLNRWTFGYYQKHFFPKWCSSMKQKNSSGYYYYSSYSYYYYWFLSIGSCY